jgi:uncharacterized protein (TIGR03066 family)
MKHSTKSKKHGGANPAQRASAALPERRSSWSHSALLVICLLVAAGGTWAFLEFVVWNKLPAELVGKWVVQGGEQDGATFDFYRSGAMVGRINVRGKEGIINAHVAVDGDVLLITTQNPSTRRDETKKQTIKTLSATELVLQDEQGNRFRMERADD